MTAATATTCPKCQSSNPIGAKFCSSCRNPLKVVQPTPPPMPPTPPPRPGPNLGFMGATGGKTETLTFRDDPETIYARLSALFAKTNGAQVQQDVPNQQLMVHMPFSNFMTTGGIRIFVDTVIQLAADPSGGTQISVQGKTDNSSTSKLWAITIAGWASIALLWLMWGMGVWGFIAAGVALGLTWWIVQTAPAEDVAKIIFKHLGSQSGKPAPMRAASAGAATAAATPPSPPSPPPEAQTAPAQAADDATANAADTLSDENEVFDRIAKLAKLKDAGAISEAEFDSKKAELLARI